MPPKASLYQRATHFLPDAWRRRARSWYERRSLARLALVSADTSRLRPAADVDIAGLLASPEIAAAWLRAAPRIEALQLPALRGGVPPGDRRALFHLIRGLAPASVLEVGTHIGASTAAIAAALDADGPAGGRRTSLTTVDIVDVNDTTARPWERQGSACSPRELIARLGGTVAVEFVTSPSLSFFAGTERRFDLVFLDGDHSASTVYREIAAALEVLNPGGALLLHDYYRPHTTYGADGSELPGPFLAVERFRREGAGFVVARLDLPPWETTLPARASSLALMLGSS